MFQTACKFQRDSRMGSLHTLHAPTWCFTTIPKPAAGHPMSSITTLVRETALAAACLGGPPPNRRNDSWAHFTGYKRYQIGAATQVLSLTGRSSQPQLSKNTYLLNAHVCNQQLATFICYTTSANIFLKIKKKPGHALEGAPKQPCLKARMPPHLTGLHWLTHV